MHVQCVSCLILPRRIPSTDFNKNPCKSFRKCGPAGQPSRFMRADEQYGKAKSPFSQLRQSVQNFYVLAAKCVCLWISMGGGGGRYSSTHSNLEPDTDVGQLHAHATLHSQSQLPVYNGYIDRCVVVGGGAQSLDAANKNLSCLCRIPVLPSPTLVIRASGLSRYYSFQIPYSLYWGLQLRQIIPVNEGSLDLEQITTVKALRIQQCQDKRYTG